VNEFYLRKLLRYSSIRHLGCVYLSIRKSSLGWVFYFFLYCIVLGRLLGPLYKLRVYHLNQLSRVKISKKNYSKYCLKVTFFRGPTSFIRISAKMICDSRSCLKYFKGGSYCTDKDKSCDFIFLQPVQVKFNSFSKSVLQSRSQSKSGSMKVCYKYFRERVVQCSLHQISALDAIQDCSRG